MGVLDNTKFILKVCELFYYKGMSQKEISSMLGISRPQVSRIIAIANEKKLVTIHLNHENILENDLQNKIKDKYGVEALVFDTEDTAGNQQYRLLAEKCADYLSIEIKDGDTVGVMAGRTIRHLADSIPLSRHHGLKFVPLCGEYSTDGTEWYSNIIAQKMASRSGGKYWFFNAPHVLKNAKAKSILMEEPYIKEMFDLISRCDICLVGIGGAMAESTGIRASQLSEDDIRKLSEMNAKANICSTYLDEEGRVVDTELSDRILGASILDIQKSRIFALACGNEKVEAIRAVLKSKLIDVLVTSIDTAQNLL